MDDQLLDDRRMISRRQRRRCRRDWSALADHGVLWRIARDHLPSFVDRIAASRVCRSWRHAILSAPDGRDGGSPRTYDDGLPFLAYLRWEPDAAVAPSCRLLDPAHGDNKHTFEDVAGLAGSHTNIVCSRDGWLLLTSPPRTNPYDGNTPYSDVFFLNLLSKKNSKIGLPTLKSKTTQFSFSHRPTSPSCVVVAFLDFMPYYVRFGFCRPGDAPWTFVEVRTDINFRGCSTNIAWSSGRFYCLDCYGNLAGFDLSGQCWTTVARQEDFGSRVNGQYLVEIEPYLVESGEIEQYLVESGAGELLRVCHMRTSSVVVVHRFDAPAGRWMPVRDLGDRALFVGRQNSKCVVAPVESMRGKVYFNAVIADERGTSDDEHVVASCSLKQLEDDEEQVSAGKGRNKALAAPPPAAGASGRMYWSHFMSSVWVDLEWPDG